MNALFENILTASFHGSIVIAAVLILRLLLRKAPKKYICLLWLLAGVRLLMPFEIQSEFSRQPQSLPDTIIRWEQPAPMQIGDAPMAGNVTPEFSPAPETPAEVSDSTPEAAAPVPEAGFRWTSLIPYLWIGVASAFILYSLFSYVNLKKKVRHAVKIPGGWESRGIDTAFILGFVRPQIYIPVGMAPATRKHILAHERTHLDKGDHWFKMIGFLALALHWFNPLVWVAYILLCKDIEMTCDERVVQFMELPERKEYSAALLRCSTNRIHYAASPVAFGEVSVKSRIRSILHYRRPSFWISLLSVIAIILVMVCLVTSPPKAADSTGGESGKASSKTSDFTAATQPPMEANPDWGVGMVAKATSNRAMTLYVGVDVEDIPWDGTPIYKDHPYWLEGWNGESWEQLPLKVQSPSYEDSYAYEMSKDNINGFYNYEELNWFTNYGELPEGDYRIGIRLTRNGETSPFYAWFHIYANALTGEEAEAVARCEASLDALLQGGAYACTIRESNALGNFLPTMGIMYHSRKGRIDSYYGDICFNSFYYEGPSYSITDTWDDVFRTKENKHISFPKGESLISDSEIRFLSSWVDTEGVECHETRTYTFTEAGKLSGVDILTQSHKDGELIQSRRGMTVETPNWGDTINPVETPNNSYEDASDSPWNIFFRVDDDLLNAGSGEVALGLTNTVGVTNYTTDGSYWLEKKNGEKWEKLPVSGEPSWGSEIYRLNAAQLTLIDKVDWTPYYGELTPGLYRMGKHFYSGEDSIIQYAEFLIHPQGGVVGEGGEAALARVDAALDKICSGNYYISETATQGGFRGKVVLDHGYWKYGEVCATDIYDYHRGDGLKGTSVTPKDDRNADLFYNQWRTLSMDWHDPAKLVMFPEGASIISDQRISFATTHIGSAGIGALSHYDFYFNEAGDIIRMEWKFDEVYDRGGSPHVLTVENKSDAEIKAWIEHAQSLQQ